MCWWECCSYKHFENISWFCLKSCLDIAHGWVNWVISTFTKFLLFFVMPIIVKVIEGAHVWIRLMIASKKSTWECYISSLSAVLALKDAWVHVSTPNSSNVVFYVEASVNELFSLATTLDIPYVNLDNGHIRSREYLNDMRHKC